MNLPNKLTMLRMFLIPVFVGFYMVNAVPHHYLWALAVFAGASLTDLADGKIARSRGLVTDFGKLMDPLADKLLVMSAMLCFVSTGTAPAIAVILILAREFLVTAIRQLAAANGKIVAADNWGKAKTVCQMVWICLGLLLLGLQAFATPAALTAGYLMQQALLGLVVLLTVVSGCRYLWQNRQLFADA